MRHKYQSPLFSILIWFIFLHIQGCGPREGKPTDADIVLAPPHPNLEEMVGISPCIYIGTVVGVRYGMHEGSQYPYTFVRFGGIEFIRNDASVPLDNERTLEISFVGGVRENMHLMEVSTQPTFDLGRRYLVFLRGGGWRLGPIPGGDQGLFQLKGRMKNDPLVVDPSGQPLAGFERGFRVFAKKKSSEEMGLEKVGAESEIPKDRARKLGLIPGKPLSSRDIQSRENQIKSKEDTKDKTTKEVDQPSQLEVEYQKVMRLSEFVSEIKRHVANTRGRYEKFRNVFLSPVPARKESELRSPSERDSLTGK